LISSSNLQINLKHDQNDGKRGSKDNKLEDEESCIFYWQEIHIYGEIISEPFHFLSFSLLQFHVLNPTQKNKE